MKTDILYRVLTSVASFLIAALAIGCSELDPFDIFDDKELDEVTDRMIAVTTSIDSFYLESDSIQEMGEKIDEIKAVEGVTDAYVNGMALYVKIDGWGTICYPFDDDDWDIQEDDMEMLGREISNLATRAGEDALHPYAEGCSVYILNAQYQEREWTRRVVNTTQDLFRSCGIQVKYEDKPIPSFYRDEIFDHDLIFIIGHGRYDSQTKLHWLETLEVFYPTETDKKQRKLLKQLKKNEANLDGEIMLSRKKDSRNSDKGVVFQTYISEKYISNPTKSTKRFAENGKAVIFVVPCQSLMGATTEHDGLSIDNSLAEAFFDKGAGLYVGYDESSSSLAQFGGMRFFANLLSGESFENALIMPDDDDALRFVRNEQDPQKTHFIDPNATYTHEHAESYYKEGILKDKLEREWNVTRHALTANGFRMDSYLESPRIISGGNPSDKGYIFNALAHYSPDASLYTDLSFTFIEPERLKYGFSVSKGDNPEAGRHRFAQANRDADSHEVDFQLSLPFASLEANTEYHLWPFIADGSSYNYGKPVVFTTDDSAGGSLIFVENLVAYYPFDGNADDMSGHSNHGILSGPNVPVLTTDRFGNPDSAYDFGGFYNYNWIRVPNSESLIFDKEFTISFWIQQSELGGMDGWGRYSTSSPAFAALCKAGDGNATYPGLYITTGKGQNGQGLSVSTNNSNGNAHTQSNWNHSIGYSKSDYELGEWLHIVLVVNNTEKILYLDGEEVARDGLNKEANFSSMNKQDLYFGIMASSNMTLGRYGSGAWYPFYGKIDDIKIYNIALDADSVALL